MKTLNAVKVQLMRRKAELEEQIKQLQSENVFSEEALYDANRAGNDVLLHESQMVKTTITKGSQKLLSDIKEALVKIEKGGYGLCNKCGHQIEHARLLIMPMATLCIACK